MKNDYQNYRPVDIEFLERIPSHWEVKEFRRLFSESSEVNGETPVGKMLSISGYRGVEVKKYDSENKRRSAAETENYRIVRPGQLAVNTMWLNYAGLGVSDYLGHVSPAYRSYNISKDLVPRYVHHLLRSSLWVSGYTALLTGIRPNSLQLGREDLMSFPVLVPPHNEQQQIADYLDHETAEIDAFITDQELFLEMTAERLESIRAHLFTSPDGQDLTTMRRIAKHISGGGFPVDFQGDPTQEIPFFKVGSLKTANAGELGESDDTISRATARRLGAFILPKDTVVLAKIGAALYLNRNARLAQPSCIDNNMLGLIPGPGVDARYLQGAASIIDLIPLGNPGAVPSLNMSWYRGVKVWLPSLGKQQRIVEKYEHHASLTNNLMTDAHQSTVLARERRAALITAAVTGQIDVTARNKPAVEQLEDDIAQGLHRES